MLYRKSGMPEEGELVLCTVIKIYPNSVFVNLDEYDKQGMIHISEISPGRIRNIRDYVTDGKKIICKVLKVDEEKGHIDLSLRRVNDGQRRQKNAEIKQEQLAEKIVELVAKELKIDFVELYNQITDKVFKDYENLYSFFEAFVLGKEKLEKYVKDKKVKKLLEEFIKRRIKPPEVSIEGELTIKSYAPNGVELIKKIFKNMVDKDNIFVRYDGAGKYYIKITADDYKHAEKILKDKITGNLEKWEKEGFEVEFERKKN